MPRIDVGHEHLRFVVSVLGELLPGRRFLAFGSRVTGTAAQFSDLDLAVIGDDPVDELTMGRLRERLSNSPLPFKVDLVDWASCSERFKAIIEAQGVPLSLESEC